MTPDIAPASPRVAEELEARFWNFVMPVPECGCWVWTGVCINGYGQFWDGQKGRKAHRWAYEHFVGPIPDGLHLDHKCRVRPCVNPDHLRPVTNKENILCGISFSAVNAVKTHCAHGHEFTPENTYYTKMVGREGRRACRACNARNARNLRKRHSAMMVKP